MLSVTYSHLSLLINFVPQHQLCLNRGDEHHVLRVSLIKLEQSPGEQNRHLHTTLRHGHHVETYVTCSPLAQAFIQRDLQMRLTTINQTTIKAVRMRTKKMRWLNLV